MGTTSLFDGKEYNCGIVRDITNRKIIEEELRCKNIQLEKKGKRIKALSKAYVQAQEQEREWISIEIHDRIIQPLTSLFQQMQTVFSVDPTNERIVDGKLLVLVKSAIKETRNIMNDLYPSDLGRHGLVKVMNEQLLELENRTGIKTQLSMGFCVTIPHSIEVTLYRIFHEALLNIERHSQANNVSVYLTLSDDRTLIELLVKDDGQGFDLETILNNSKSKGIQSMKRRAEVVGGELFLDSRRGKGTAIEVHLPVKEMN